MKLIISVFILVFYFTFVLESKERIVEVKILPQHTAVSPGATFELGMLFRLKPDWYIYWINPGDAGLPTLIDWQLPSGFELVETKYPAPEPFKFSIFMNYGYKKEVFIISVIKAPAIIAEKNIKFAAQFSWLQCKDECIKDSSYAEIMLPVSSKYEVNEQWREKSKQYKNKFPVEINNKAISSEVNGNVQTIEIVFQNEIDSISEEIYYFPLDEGIYNHGSPATITVIDNKIIIEQKLDTYRIEEPFRVFGVLKSEKPLFNSTNSTAIQIHSSFK